MKASMKFRFTVSDDGVIALFPYSGRMHLLGSSVFHVSKHRTDLNVLYLYPNRGEDGMVAVSVMEEGEQGLGMRASWTCTGFVIPVTWKEGEDKPTIDTESIWIPSRDRKGQVSSYDIRLMIGEECFSTSQQEKVARYLPCPDVACRYLVGQATAEEVIAVADEPRIQKDLAAEVNRLTAEVQSLEDSVRLREADYFALQARHDAVLLASDEASHAN